MSEHRRWVCRDCHREFINPEPVGAGMSVGIGVLDENGKQRPWDAAVDGCRGCKSLNIELVKYEPSTPGTDVPRGQEIPVTPVTAPDVIPAPLPLVATTQPEMASGELSVAQPDVWQFI